MPEEGDLDFGFLRAVELGVRVCRAGSACLGIALTKKDDLPIGT